MINVRDYGAVGDGTANDYQAFIAAIAASKTVGPISKPSTFTGTWPAISGPCPVYVPTGYYKVNQTIVTGDFRGFVGDGKTSSSIIAGASMPYVLDVRTMNRGTLRDLRVDGAGLADTGIISDFNMNIGGPSLNNIYSDIFIENHLTCGWHADDNNDCYFERIFITSSGQTSFMATASGGPLQFLNCNFLGEVHVIAQNISFSYCVTGGIVLRGSSFNLLKYEGGYAYTSPHNNAVVYIAGDGNGGTNNTYPTETGPITFSGSHIEMPDTGSIIGGAGLFHFGINATGCHIFNPGSTGKGNIIGPSVTSVFYPAATNKFSNCNFQRMNTPTTYNGFTNVYENCYIDNYYSNEPNYLKTTGGDVATVLGLPGIGQDAQSRASNRFVTGTQDGAAYDHYNFALRGHWGMALKTYNDSVTGFVDFRLGKIDLLDGFYVNGHKIPDFSQGLPQYADNSSALTGFHNATGKLYHTAGVVKITY
jgi:hypothetical protein